MVIWVTGQWNGKTERSEYARSRCGNNLSRLWMREDHSAQWLTPYLLFIYEPALGLLVWGKVVHPFRGASSLELAVMQGSKRRTFPLQVWAAPLSIRLWKRVKPQRVAYPCSRSWNEKGSGIRQRQKPRLSLATTEAIGYINFKFRKEK